MSRYEIWNKQDTIITPSGAVFTPEQWIEKYPVAGLLDVVCSGGAVKGAYFGIYDQMKEMYTSMGCDFSECETQQDVLDVIESFEDARTQPVPVDEDVVSDEARIADALEDLVVLREIASSAE